MVGVDPSEGLLKLAKRKFNYHENVKLIKASAESMPFTDSEFDVVISLTAIQNFSSIEKGLSEICRVGKKKFVLTYLKRSKKRQEIEHLIKKIFSAYGIERHEEEKDVIFFIGNT